MEYSIKDKLKELREEAGKSQMTVAKETGISQSSIARWELGASEPRATDIRILCSYYNITPNEMLEISG